jgi:UDP-N-acetylmuramate--alanine ligase
VHQAVRELYPEHKVLAVFSPIYLVELAILLMIKVYLILMKFIDGYPRELPMEGFVRMVVVKMENKNKKLVVKENVIESILASDKVIVTIDRRY